jgi:exopolysaccharide biosynthesis WecB/TagA/CpsF family protein
VKLEIDDLNLPEFLGEAARFGSATYGYVVTPNVDHLIRYFDEIRFRNLYSGASFVLLDSQFLARMLRLRHALRLNVCPGSDIVAELFANVIVPADKVVLIGASVDQASKLVTRFALQNLHHKCPPMGFINSPALVEECLQFIEQVSPFRYCLLAVGSPQQEELAYQLALRGRARGLALCVGASIDFLTGKERRAPKWMRKFALEWLYRLSRNPARLAHRYLVRGPRVFLIVNLMAFSRRHMRRHEDV